MRLSEQGADYGRLYGAVVFDVEDDSRCCWTSRSSPFFGLLKTTVTVSAAAKLTRRDPR